MVLKDNQSRVVEIRAPEVKLPHSGPLRVLNCLPKQERHTPPIVNTRVRAAILVHHGVAVTQRQDAGDGTPSFGSDTNLEPVTETRNQVPEPIHGLRRHFVPSARQNEQVIKFLQKNFRCSFLVAQILTLGASNLPLNRILLKPPKKLPESRLKIQRVEAKRIALLHAGFREQVCTQRAKLEVFELFSVESALQRTKDFFAFRGVFHQRLAVVGKGQRDHPGSRQPTADATEDDSIRQR